MQPSILYLVLQEKSWKSSKALHFHIKVNLKSCINLQHSLKCGSNVDLKKYQKNWVLELQLNHQFVITQVQLGLDFLPPLLLRKKNPGAEGNPKSELN